jgi:hypothetical protein
MAGTKNVHNILQRISLGKHQIGIQRTKWQSNIKIGSAYERWKDLTSDRVELRVLILALLNLRVLLSES